MELLKLAKFKLRLQALATEIRDLREREQSSKEQCHALLQKQRLLEEEHATKLQELQAEKALSNELIRKLERKVSYLENDNSMFESQQKDLKETIQSLLQSQESFVNVYQENTCEMMRSIEAKDKKVRFLLDKINSHLLLFDSIEKEALSIKKIVDNVHLAVSAKEEVVASLRNKMDKVSTFENMFFENILDMKNKIKSNGDEIKRKDRIISELEAQLDAAGVTNSCQTGVQELQKILSAKDLEIKNLISQKEALQCEMGYLSRILQKIQKTILKMNEKDKSAFSSMLYFEEDTDTIMISEDNRCEKMIEDTVDMHPMRTSIIDMAEDQASPSCEQNSDGNPQRGNNNFGSCVSEVEHTVGAQLLDSECSTTQDEISQIRQ